MILQSPILSILLPALPLLSVVTFAGVDWRAGGTCTVGWRAGGACRVVWRAGCAVSAATGGLFFFRVEVLSLPKVVELSTAVGLLDVPFLAGRFFDG
jgi:hypothetical protein